MSEARVIVRHAGTVLIGQLAVMAFGVTDTIVSGRYAQEALAALSVGSAIFITVFVSLLGLLQALLPVWAELHGAGRTVDIGRSVRQSLYLCALVAVSGMAVLLFPGALMRWTQVPPEMRAEVEIYLRVLAFALPPALLFRLYSTLNQGIGKPQLVTWLQLASLGIKLPLSIWFCFGGAGMPSMGVVGCAWATLVVEYTMALLALWLLHSQAVYRPYALWQRMERLDWQQLRQFARLGVPAALAVLVEITSFTLMALFIARLGTAAAAAHQIAANLTAVAYMVPLSLGIATSARISFWLGAGDVHSARRAGRIGLAIALGIAVSMAGGMVLLRHPLSHLYSEDASVSAMAASLLLITAGYHLADAVQTLCVFILRSYRVTIAPLVIYCALLWGAGLGGGYALTYTGLGPWAAMRSPVAFWSTSTGALVVTAILFCALLGRTVRQRGRAGFKTRYASN